VEGKGPLKDLVRILFVPAAVGNLELWEYHPSLLESQGLRKQRTAPELDCAFADQPNHPIWIPSGPCSRA